MSFVSMSEAILTAIRLVSFVVIVIIMAVVANTMAMSVRERMGEYAVFKTLGFGGGYIAGLILGESLVITILGGLLGIGAHLSRGTAFLPRPWATIFPVFHRGRGNDSYLDMAAAFWWWGLSRRSSRCGGPSGAH